MQATLHECQDHDVVYGILTVENIPAEEVQRTIYNIKEDFCIEGFDGWTIEDVFERFPSDWKWSYSPYEAECEIEI